ncbi:S-adenosyl-L-methionine-dependent methyltransferase [Immersiella caudata]|uniref:S-adenosyl-L-methionine-dependent methyltransferase n=1 Tax=Immersiella caudata TaxID=314043 RepID=A0AA39WLR2_9PEZI|nr:S-adenosyl-L-methionine-dependent methyltransferase [Immersiella caudata]
MGAHVNFISPLNRELMQTFVHCFLSRPLAAASSTTANHKGRGDAFDFADEFPECEVIGTDISPIQPSWTWFFPDNSLDFVHIRWLIGSIPDWNALFAEAYRVLKPGGWLENIEPTDRIEGADGGIKPTDALGQWHQIFRAGEDIIGSPFDLFDTGTQKKAFEAVGFEEIQSKDITIPLSQWAKKPKWKEIGMAPEEVEVYIKLAHQAVRSIKKRALFAERVVWGRKPEA